MDQVNAALLRLVDTAEWADRPKLFADTFGGWNTLEYMAWIERQKKLYHIARGTKQYGLSGRARPEDCSITDQNDFTAWLQGQAKKEWN